MPSLFNSFLGEIQRGASGSSSMQGVVNADDTYGVAPSETPTPPVPVAPQPGALPKPEPKPDALAAMLNARRTKYSDDQAKATVDAKATEAMSDDEKVAYALLGALPGLVGLIGGGLAGGGYGAAAGLAGGLGGGAAGMQAIADAKQSKRKELLAQADKAGDRLARVDDQALSHAETLQTQDFTAKQSADSQARSAAQSDKELAARAEMSKEELAARSKEGANNRANALQLKRMDIFGDAQRAGIAAAGKAKEQHSDLKDFQGKSTQFSTSMLLAQDVLDGMKDPSLWNTMSTWSGLQSALSDPKRQKYARAALNFIDAVTRDVSGAAITPTEWEAKFRQYLPTLGSSPDDINYAQQFRHAATETMLKKSGPGAEFAMEAYRKATAPQQSAPQISQQDRTEALKWLEANPDDEHAAEVRTRLGM